MIEMPSRSSLYETQVSELVNTDKMTARPSSTPIRLNPRDVRRLEALFQPRETSLLYSQGNSRRHIRTLAKSALEGDLDPVAIVAFGDGWYLVDGHHRLEAYIRAEHVGSVPVQVHHSDKVGRARVVWAIGLSTALNSKEKLPMSGADKFDAAWRSVVMGGKTKQQIHLDTRASVATISTMRRILKELVASGSYEAGDLQTKQWSLVSFYHRTLGEPLGDQDPVARYDRKLRLLIKQLTPAFNSHVDAELLLTALEVLKPGVTDEIVMAAEERLLTEALGI